MSVDRCFNVWDFRTIAQKRLPKPFWGFLEGSADDSYTFDRNMAAFRDYEIQARTLVDVSSVDSSTTVLGQKLKWPVFLAPTGASRMWHHSGELAAARAAAKSGTLYGLSTVSTTSLEDVAKATDGPKMLQVYVMRDPAFNKHLLERAKVAGFEALCLTVDSATIGNRERDWRNGFSSPPQLTPKTVASIMMKPRWCAGFMRHRDLSFANVKDWVESNEGQNSTLKTTQRYVGAQLDSSVTWERAEEMIKMWGGEFAIKGVQCVEDAKRSAGIGATGVILSNHGGRQLDSTSAPIDLVADVADAVGDQLDVIMDSGVRRGTDVIKALARGAKAVGIGRPYLYALAAGGEAAVDRLLYLLYIEVKRGMMLTGVTKVEDLDRSFIREMR